MKTTSVLRYSAIGMASLGLAGLAAASTGNISGATGPHSNNTVHIANNNGSTMNNTNRLALDNLNAQGSSTGHVNAYENTSVTGGVGSGDAMNSSTTSTNLNVHNSAPVMTSGFGSGSDSATISGPTGPHSNNQVTIDNNNQVHATNNNSLDLRNMNLQLAQSGNASASENTTVGGVYSGNASNSSTTTTSVTVSN